MSSRRRDRSRSREKSRERSPRARLRMDAYQARNGGRSKGTPPRSREIDSVMKRARRSDSQSTYWNKKLLEVEEKDPNRWRHSGYKELYHRTGSSKSNSDSVSRSRSRSKSQSNSTSRSLARVGSPRRGGVGVGRARTPQRDLGGRVRSPGPGTRGGRSPRIRSPRTPSRTRERSLRRDTGGHSIQRESSLNRRGKPIRTRSPRGGERVRSRSPRSMRKPRSPGPRSPPPKKAARVNRSKSYSSETSSSCCSNESCSVCSPPHKGTSKEREIPIKEKPRELPKMREVKKEPTGSRARPIPRTPPERSRSRSFSVPRSKPIEKKKKKKEKPFKLGRPPFIKVESDSESSSGRGSTVGIVSSISGPKLSLSERFGRMAQWSTDRDMEHRNLRITAGDRLTVEMDSPPSPLYPPSLSSLADLGSWDDVRVRYAYYKERGYLKDLTLQDYIKWEQWWYKYQDWLESDCYYRRRL